MEARRADRGELGRCETESPGPLGTIARRDDGNEPSSGALDRSIGRERWHSLGGNIGARAFDLRQARVHRRRGMSVIDRNVQRRLARRHAGT